MLNNEYVSLENFYNFIQEEYETVFKSIDDMLGWLDIRGYIYLDDSHNQLPTNTSLLKEWMDFKIQYEDNKVVSNLYINFKYITHFMTHMKATNHIIRLKDINIVKVLFSEV